MRRMEPVVLFIVHWLVRHAIMEVSLTLIKNNSSEKTVFFYHIPKCAGTTLNIEVFKKKFKPDELIFVYDFTTQVLIQRLKEMTVREQEKIKCISGHCYFGAHRNFYARPLELITVLREPVERVISHYYQVRRHKPHYLHKVVNENKLTLKQYVENKLSNELDNGQVRIMVGLENNVPYGGCTRELLELAKENLEKHFAVVGLTERFDDFLRLLNHIRGWDIKPKENLNVGGNRLKKDDIDDETIDTITKYNQLDIELYDFARQLFVKQYSEHFPPRAG